MAAGTIKKLVRERGFRFIPLRVDTPQLTASSSYRRKPVSR
ncbi:hypothetical protein [Candidatus Methylomirabilis sp.]